MLANKTRSLNFNQTLEELLGAGRNNKAEQGGLSAAGRPPTRHGRESVSSSEENREPGTSPSDSQKPGTSSSDSQKPGTASSDSQKSNDAMENKDVALNDEDEFLAKLNEVRRRSLVNMKDVRENQRERQPSEITEESEEDPNNNSTSSKKLLSRSSTSESGHTFRVTSEPGVSLPPIDVPTPVPRMSLTEPTPTGSPARKTAEEPKDSAPSATGTSQHDAWLRKKIEEARQKKQRERQAAKKKEEEEKERREQAKKLFERWKNERDEKLREERRRQRAKEKEKRQAEEERKKEKKIEAEKTFQAWKRSHSATRRTGLSDAEKEKQRQKEEARKEAEKAFETWKRNKDAAEQAERRKAAERELAEKKRLEEEREYRELLARQTYETWLEIKENERMMAQSLASLGFEEPEPLPWLPPSNTCPRRFTPTLRNRNRSLDGRPRAVSAQNPRLKRTGSVKTIFSMK
uniref:Coiled-coil domain-containing protein 181 n=1 Tax=Haemonchus contortus TaxID=6289 RepID=A0A7I4YHE6_HAECO